MKYAFSFGLIVFGLFLLWAALSGKLAWWAQAITNLAQSGPSGTATANKVSLPTTSGVVGGVPTTLPGLQALFPATPNGTPISWPGPSSYPGYPAMPNVAA